MVCADRVPTVSEPITGQTACLQGTDANYFAKSIGSTAISSPSQPF